MEDNWLSMAVVRQGDLIWEGDQLVLVLTVEEQLDGSRKFRVLKGDVVYEVYRDLGTYVLGELVAWIGDNLSGRSIINIQLST
jgi:hypothetical protein